MRYALPIFHCLPGKVQGILRKHMDSIPPCVWVEWPHDIQQVITVVLDKSIDYGKFMRKSPSSPKKTK